MQFYIQLLLVVHLTYETVPYYEKLIDQDRQRVDKLFSNQSSNIKLTSIEWNDFKNHLIQYRTPCLVLVDANKLDCCTCKRTRFDRLLERFLPSMNDSYQGHYILVNGFTRNETTEFIRYIDPNGKEDSFCTITKETFDLARKAFGTDEDVIFCYEKETQIKTQSTDTICQINCFFLWSHLVIVSEYNLLFLGASGI